MRYFSLLTVLLILQCIACNNNPASHLTNNKAATSDSLFANFETRFMDAYWKQNPSASIFAGYGKYYDELKIPDSAGFASDVAFAKNWLDSLHGFHYDDLATNNKIDYDILNNQFHRSTWYIDTFRLQE